MGEVYHAQSTGKVVTVNNEMISQRPAAPTSEQNMDGKEVITPSLRGWTEAINAMGELKGGTHNIDYRLGNVVTATISTATTTYTFTSPPDGMSTSFSLWQTNGGSRTVNFPAGVIWSGGAPELTASGLDYLSFTYLGIISGVPKWAGFYKLNVSTDTTVAHPSVATVFKVENYTADGNEKTLTTNLAFATNGGITIIKGRDVATEPVMFWKLAASTVYKQRLNTTESMQTSTQGVKSWSDTGFTIGTDANVNTNGKTYTSISLRKSPKFMDEVNFIYYGAPIAHNLGSVPGMAIIKDIYVNNNWFVVHRSVNGIGYLDDNRSFVGTNKAGIASNKTDGWLGVNAATFDPGNFCQNFGWYKVIVIAHETSASGCSQCGTFTTNESGAATVTGLINKPQFVFLRGTGDASPVILLDTARGWADGTDKAISTYGSATEVTNIDYGAPTADGFTVLNLAANAIYIYWTIKEVT